jgi:hypothetical protein
MQRRDSGTISRSFIATTAARATPARPVIAPPQRPLGASVTRSLSLSTTATAPPPALPPSNAPSADYRQHHDVQAPEINAATFRPGWRVHSRLDALATSGKIDREQLEAAATWGRWAERTGSPGTSPWRIRVDGGVTSADGHGVRTLAAATKLRESAAALGAARYALLHACVFEDRSWRHIGRRLGVAIETAQARTAEAIAALALWLRGDPVPPPPAIRFRNQPSSR